MHWVSHGGNPNGDQEKTPGIPGKIRPKKKKEKYKGITRKKSEEGNKRHTEGGLRSKEAKEQTNQKRTAKRRRARRRRIIDKRHWNTGRWA